MSRVPVEFDLFRHEYDEEYVKASINLFIANLEFIDKFILTQLTNQNQAPNRLIKTRAENESYLTNQLKPQAHFKRSKHTDHAQKTMNKKIISANLRPEISCQQEKRHIKQ